LEGKVLYALSPPSVVAYSTDMAGVSHFLHKRSVLQHLTSELQVLLEDFVIELVKKFGRLVAGLSPRRPGFAPGPIYVGFVVDRVALGQVLLRVLRFSPVIIIPPGFHAHISSEGRPVGDCSSETWSHPVEKLKKVKKFVALCGTRRSITVRRLFHL
jgi:hypothetical protein